MVRALSQADALEQISGAAAGVPFISAQLGGKEHILLRGQGGDKLIGLKNKAEFASPHAGEVVFAQVRNIRAVEKNAAGGYGIKPGQQAQQSTLAAAGSAHDRKKLAARYGKGDTAQNLYPIRRILNHFPEVVYLNHTGQEHRQSHVNLMDVVRTSVHSIVAVCVAASFFLSACARNANSPQEEKRTQAEPSSTAASEPARGEPQPAAAPIDGPAIVTFGDSLTAGVAGRSYPSDLQDLLTAHGYNYRIDNQGVSGDTTTDGLARIGNVIAEHPALVILEFGGNDGLRGIPVNATKKNLQEMIMRLKEADIPIVLLGITLPPNYGPDYVKPFTAIFPELARQYHLKLMPFLLLNVYQHPDLMQPDGIHPNGEGNKIVAEDVFHLIEPGLSKQK